jgi:hypothetical protein
MLQPSAQLGQGKLLWIDVIAVHDGPAQKKLVLFLAIGGRA